MMRLHSMLLHVALAILLGSLLVSTASAQTIDSNVATMSVVDFFSSFEVETFRTRVGSALNIDSNRVTVSQYAPFPLLDPTAAQTQVTFLILNQGSAAVLPLGSDAVGLLKYYFDVRTSNATLANNGLVVTAMVVGEDPAAPDSSSSSDGPLSAGAIVLIIFAALLACCLCGLAAALVLFIFKLIRKTITSHRHRRLDVDYTGHHSDFDDSDTDNMDSSSIRASSDESDGMSEDGTRMQPMPSSSDVYTSEGDEESLPGSSIHD